MHSNILGRMAVAIVGAAAGLFGAVSQSQAQCLPAPPDLVEAGYLTVGTTLTAPPWAS